MHSFNKDHLPHVTSSVTRFLSDSDGYADGLILANGVQVHFRPHLSAVVLMSVHVGDRITVYGLLPVTAPRIAAVVIEAPNGIRIVDDRPPIPLNARI